MMRKLLVGSHGFTRNSPSVFALLLSDNTLTSAVYGSTCRLRLPAIDAPCVEWQTLKAAQLGLKTNELISSKLCGIWIGTAMSCPPPELLPQPTARTAKANKVGLNILLR